MLHPVCFIDNKNLVIHRKLLSLIGYLKGVPNKRSLKLVMQAYLHNIKSILLLLALASFKNDVLFVMI